MRSDLQAVNYEGPSILLVGQRSGFAHARIGVASALTSDCTGPTRPPACGIRCGSTPTSESTAKVQRRLRTGTDRGIDTIVPGVWPPPESPLTRQPGANHDRSKVQGLRGTRPFLRHSSAGFGRPGRWRPLFRNYRRQRGLRVSIHFPGMATEDSWSRSADGTL